MSRTTSVTYDGGGNVVSTTRSKTSLCGCGGLFMFLVATFVVIGPAYYASRGNWPGGWAGAVLAYLAMAAILVAAMTAAMRKQRGQRAVSAPPAPPPLERPKPVYAPPPPSVQS